MDRGARTTVSPSVAGWEAKIVCPQPFAGAIPRPRLLDAITSDLDRIGVVVLSAAAGYGKTTLAAQWAAQHDGHVAWVNIDAQDDEPPEVFIRCLRAMQTAIPGYAAAALLSAQTNPGSWQTEALPASQAEAQTLDQPLTLVLNDLDDLPWSGLQDTLNRSVRYLPQKVRLLITTQDHGIFDLPQLSLREKVKVVGRAALAFTAEETMACVDAVLDEEGSRPSADEVKRLQRQTNGWPAGVMLACAAATRGRPLALDTNALSVRTIMRRSTIGRLPPERAEFLLGVAVVDHVDEGLARHLTGIEDALPWLEDFERLHILEPLSDRSERSWRIPRVVQGFLRSELKARQPVRWVGVVTRAAEWLAEQHDLEQAYALAAQLPDDDLALRLMGQGHMHHSLSGGAAWVVRHAGELAARHPELPGLRLAQAWAAVNCGRDHEAEVAVRMAEERVTQEPDATQIRAGVAALRSHLFRRQGRFAEAVRSAEEALQLTEGVAGQLHLAFNEDQRTRMRLHLGIALFAAGQLDRGEEHLWAVVTSDLPRLTRDLAESYLAVIDWVEGQSDPTSESRLAELADRHRDHHPVVSTFATAIVVALQAPGHVGADAQRDAEVICSGFHEPGISAMTASARALRMGKGWDVLAPFNPTLISDGVDAAGLLALANERISGLSEQGVLPRMLNRVAVELGQPRIHDTFHAALTEQEQRILGMLSGSLTEREIGRELHLAHNTVRTYRRRLYRKLGVSSRAAAVAVGRADE